MGPEPQVTVVVPTYQRAGTVERAVRSVLAQEGPTFEVVVVDDGSTDETAQVLAPLESEQVRVIRQENSGRGAARNAGARAARAPMLTFLDSDDEALPGWLDAIASRAAAPGVAAVRCGILRVEPGSAPVRLAAGPLDAAHPLPRGACQPGSLAVATEVFRRIGGFDPALEFSENTDLLVRLALDMRRSGWRSATFEGPVVVHHRDPVADRDARYGDAPARAAALLLRRYANEMAEDRRTRSDYLAILGTHHRRAGRRRDAARAFTRAWWAQPLSLTAAARLLSVVVPVPLLQRARRRTPRRPSRSVDPG